MTTTWGTSHFVSRKAAERYYRAYGYEASAITRMLAEGLMHIGPPQTKAGERLSIIDRGTRYAITSN